MKTLRAHQDLWGRWVESAIGSHLLNHRLTEHFTVYYWRENNQEVDFVIQNNEKLSAMEVKTGTVRTKAGMNAFSKKYPAARTLLIGQDGIGVEDFLQIPVKNLV